ncbi:hypothetical protein EX895_000758 [Sporisorium graminicola]|uniref:WD repeat-containing protein 44 n=1 Tax=Sporisorium graminicola TaxID=280036 RepID=A0A4U7L1T4_9BASI|nr:hypothetical protein EX895_000758 [Sporisorium graminicola]TKY90760.1 hypothetical protein EX895_000758 [Sporisorium graminicola]
MTTLPSHTDTDPAPSCAPPDAVQYNQLPSTGLAAMQLPNVLFPSSSSPLHPTISISSSSSSSSSSSDPSFEPSDARDSPSTPPAAAGRSSRFRLPRLSLWGLNPSDTVVCHTLSSQTDIPTDFDKLQISRAQPLSLHLSTGTDEHRLASEADSPSPSPPGEPMLAIHEPVRPPPMSSPKLGSVWRLGGGLFASSSGSPTIKPEPRRGRPQTADPSTPRSATSPASQFASWSELMHCPAPPNRTTTFSSISSASCSSYSRPCVKKVRSQDSIRSSHSARPLDFESSSLHSYGTVPIPRVIKTKLRSKSKAKMDHDLDNVFLAQELHAASSSSKNALPARSPSWVPKDFSSQDNRHKRSSLIARRSTSPHAVQRNNSIESVPLQRRTSDVYSPAGFHDAEWGHVQPGRIDRQLSTGSHLTTASSGTTSSSEAGEALTPRSPRLTSDQEPSAEYKAKPTKESKRKTYALQFSLDGRYLAAAGSDHLIRVYEVISSPSDRTDEIELAQMHRPDDSCHRKMGSACSQGFCPSGRSQAKTDARTANTELAPVFKSTPVHVFAGHTGDVLDLSWSKNNFLLSCSSDKTARLWHPNRSDCLCTFTTSATVSSVDFHPVDDRFFVTGGLDGKLRLWNISARRVQSINDVPGVITAVAFSASGATVCVGTHSGSVVTFACTETLTYVSAVTVKSAAAAKTTPASKITSIQPIKLDAATASAAVNTRSTAAKPESEYMTITSNDSRVRIYSIASRRLVSRFKSPQYMNRSSQIRATTSSDSQYIISGSEDASIHVWSVASSAPLFANLFSGMKRNKSILKQGGAAAAAATAAADAGDNSTCRSWQAGSGSVRCAVFAPAATAHLLALALDPLETAEKAKPGSRIIVSTDDSNAIRIWRSDPHARLV